MLDAARIPAAVEGRLGNYLLVVVEEDLERAVRELDDYRREEVPPPPDPPLEPLSGGWAGILVYALVLVGVARLAEARAFAADWFDAGRAQAGRMVDGEWWRAVTALTLHVDARHLLGNLLFGSVLGLLAAQGLGAGVSWLAIVLGGTLGNIVNARLHSGDHSAVGASTAVFAALGLMVALALHHNRRRRISAVRRWSPLIAGVLLLAWTGMGGERTDVLAHVTGLVAGLAVGFVCGFAPPGLLEQRPVQVVAAVAALAILVGAWALALGYP